MTLNKILLILSAICFALGISLPLFSMNAFVVFNDSFSLLAATILLLQKGELLLFLVLFIFSIVLPILKQVMCFKIVFNRYGTEDQKNRYAKKLAATSKWSMADVFVIAVIAATIKVGGMFQVNVHIGILFFTLSVISSMILVQKILSDYELVPKQGR